MKHLKRVTAMLPEDLLERAMRATGEGVTPTLHRGLELIAAKDAYKALLRLKGKLDLKIDLDEFRRDGRRAMGGRPGKRGE